MTAPTDRADKDKDRATRLAEALRANLRRRKAQARGRKTTGLHQENATKTAQDSASDEGEASGDRH